MASVLANNFLLQLLKKELDFDTDEHKVILMQSGFAFNRETHAAYSNVSGSELASAYGYTSGGATLTGVNVTQDNDLNAGKVTWANATWSVSGGNLTASGAIIYNNTHASKVIVGYLDFGGDQTTLDGGVASIANLLIKITG